MFSQRIDAETCTSKPPSATWKEAGVNSQGLSNEWLVWDCGRRRVRRVWRIERWLILFGNVNPKYVYIVARHGLALFINRSSLILC